MASRAHCREHLAIGSIAVAIHFREVLVGTTGKGPHIHPPRARQVVERGNNGPGIGRPQTGLGGRLYRGSVDHRGLASRLLINVQRGYEMSVPAAAHKCKSAELSSSLASIVGTSTDYWRTPTKIAGDSLLVTLPRASALPSALIPPLYKLPSESVSASVPSAATV